MIRSFVKIFLCLFAFSSVYAQEDSTAIDTSRIVLPLLPKVELPEPKPQKIELVPTEEKVKKPDQMLEPVPQIGLPVEKQRPEESKQIFGPFPQIQEPEIKEYRPPQEWRFQPLSPIQAPETEEQIQRGSWQLDHLSPVVTPQEKIQPNDAGQIFSPLGSIGIPYGKERLPDENRGWSFSPLSQIEHPQPVHPPDNPGWEHARFALATLPSVPTPRSQYNSFKLSNFAGLNLTGFPTDIADNEFVDLVNFIWSPSGKLIPRKGFTKYNPSEFDAGKKIYGLHIYRTSDDEKIFLAGVNAKVWADTMDTNRWFNVKAGLQSNSKNYYFETFKGKTIVVHEGDYPFVLNSDMQDELPFGLCDSVTVVNGSFSACSAWIWIAEPKGWQDDQWAGYLFTKHRKPKVEVGTPAQASRLIHSNGTGTNPYTGQTQNYLHFITRSDVVSFLDNDYQYIYGLFDYDSLQTVVVDSVVDGGDSCQQSIWSSAFMDSLAFHERVIRTTSGKAAGQERQILSQNLAASAEVINPQHMIDSISAGDTLLVLENKFWKAKLCEIYKNRVFLVVENDYPQGNEFIVFSENNSLTHFDPDNYFLVKTEDGDKITVLKGFYDDQLGYKDQSRDCMMIYKENSIFKLVWNSETDYYLVQVADGVGCTAPRTLVSIDGKYHLFAHTTGIYACDGRTVTLVSKKVQPLFDDITWAFRVATAGFMDRHYYLSYPDGGWGRCNKTAVMNTDWGFWGEIQQVRGNVFVRDDILDTYDTTEVTLYFSDWQDKTYIYEFGDAETDTGEGISLYLQSKSFDLQNIFSLKRFSYFDINYYLDSDSVDAEFYTDFGDSLRFDTKFGGSGGNRYKRISLNGDCVGRNLSFKLMSDNKFELGAVSLRFKEIGE
jgi:hypothetical protein